MARKFFRRILPNANTGHKKSSIPFVGALLHDPNLFHLNRHSVSLAFALGIFMALTPLLGGQMILIAIISIWIRCNLPIAMALVWITNPLTISPIFFAQYKLGLWVLQAPSPSEPIEFSWQWLTEQFAVIWQPFLLGALLSAIFFSALSYLIVQWFWRWKVLQSWKRRKLKMTKST